jgi:hypothetical protein
VLGVTEGPIRIRNDLCRMYAKQVHKKYLNSSENIENLPFLNLMTLQRNDMIKFAIFCTRTKLQM